MSKLEREFEKANILRKSIGVNRIFGKNILEGYEAKNSYSHYILPNTDSNFNVANEYGQLKSMLIKETNNNLLSTIAIMSSINNEGKSITSINLAIALSQEIDRAVLLIDANLRKPVLHKYLGIKCKYGLSDYLSRDIDLSDVLIRTEVGKVVLIPAGSVVMDPDELLSSKKMKILMKAIKEWYVDRYVIIDTTSILSCSESNTIGSYVDGIIFLIRESYVSRRSIANALNIIEGLDRLNVVCNDLNATNLDTLYSYGYSSHSKGEIK